MNYFPCPESGSLIHVISDESVSYYDQYGVRLEPRNDGVTLAKTSTCKCDACGNYLITYNLAWPHGHIWDNRPQEYAPGCKGGWTLIADPIQLQFPGLFVIHEEEELT